MFLFVIIILHMNDLPAPLDGAIIYEDEYLYVCLANFPITIGHTVVVWKERVSDLHLLNEGDYEYLMNAVDHTRNLLIDVLGIDKVYLMYMDEIKHVHWHLIPRYEEQGFCLLNHNPARLEDTTLAETLKSRWGLPRLKVEKAY